MKKTVLITFCILLIILPLIPPQKTSAAAVPLRLGVQGVKMITGIGSKLGIKYGDKKATEIAIKRWNLDLWERYNSLNVDEKKLYDNMINRLNNPEVVPIPEKPGWGKVIIDSTLMITGADLLLEGYNYFKDMREQKKMAEVWDDLNLNPDSDYVNYGNINIRLAQNTQLGLVAWYMKFGTVEKYFQASADPNIDYEDIVAVWFNILSAVPTDAYSVPATVYDLMLFAKDINGRTYFKNQKYTVPTADIQVGEVPNIVTTDVPDLPPLQMPNGIPLPLSNPSMPTVPSDFPKEIEIQIPLSDDWNLPDIEFNNPVGDIYPNPNPNPDPETNPDPARNPKPNPNPNPETDLDPDAVEEPLPEGVTPPTIPPTKPPDSQSCKPSASDLLGLFLNFLVGDLDCIDWSKLKQSGGFFTNKFPFSIPWDIGRAMKAVFGGMEETTEMPKFQFKIKDWSTEIQLPQYFSNWFSVIKIMILVIFDIGLIYAVRKMLGGAS